MIKKIAHNWSKQLFNLMLTCIFKIYLNIIIFIVEIQILLTIYENLIFVIVSLKLEQKDLGSTLC